MSSASRPGGRTPSGRGHTLTAVTPPYAATAFVADALVRSGRADTTVAPRG